MLESKVLAWCLDQLGSKPRLIGVNGPQGAGKSTLTKKLCIELERLGHRACTISIDDFYLTRAEQVELAQAHPENPYLQNRGYPGTHDIRLGEKILDDMKGQSGVVHLPRYEKSLHGGKGDRLPSSEWPTVCLPLDVIFFEGWMLVFKYLDQIEDPSLADINVRLKNYDKWWQRLDALVQLKPKDYTYVVNWRVEAEQKMRASGKPGMSDAETRQYVELFLPAYVLYLPQLKAPPGCASLVIEIGLDRN